MERFDTNFLLREILNSLKRIEDLFFTQNSGLASSSTAEDKDKSVNHETPPLDVVELINNLSLNDEHLIPTIKALLTSKTGGSAQSIAAITKRSRSRENQHLNRLVELGYVQKKREGREVRFFLPP